MRVARSKYLGVGHILPDPHWGIKAHAHAFHEMIVVVGGRMWVEGSGRTYSCTIGDVLLYPAGVAHSERSDPHDPLESFFIAFLCPTIRGNAIIRIRDDRGRIREMVRWIEEDELSADEATSRERQTLVLSLLNEFLRDAAEEHGEIVASTRHYVSEHIADRITLADLAARVRLSKFHFLRSYKAAAGRTPMEDVRAIRIGFARELVLRTGLPLKEIAPRAGLGDEYSLSRLLKKELGMSSRKLRQFQQ